MQEVKEKFQSALLKKQEAAQYLNVTPRWLQRNAFKIPIESALLTRKEAALYLNKSERWMQRARAHHIPFIKLGKSVYFMIPDLDKYIARNRIGGDMS